VSIGIADFRSDTVTRPCAQMRKLMAEAEVGDDVIGDDPTVRRLEERAAALFEVEAALFMPSGTMSNQVAVKALTQPGDEILCGEHSHVFLYESGALGLISGVQTRPLPELDGVLPVESIEAAIRRPDVHHPTTRLVALENTHNYAGGRVLPLHRLTETAQLARQEGLALFLDGARICNAAVAAGVAPSEYARSCDLLAMCLSKGLGCPVGSVLLGSQMLIARCHRLRKALGGGLRQVGILAAPGIWALDHLRERLAEDHQRARRLAQEASQLPGFRITPESVETNIVLLGRPAGDAQALVERLRKEEGVLCTPFSDQQLKFVTHRDVDDRHVDQALSALARSE
jgi:threonine aldolase